MLTFENRGIKLEYEVSGEGKPFIFLHGMGGGIGQIKSIYEPIDGVQLITMNQQGHGNSGVDWDNFTFDRLGDDVVALLNHLGIGKAYFGGISMGAAVSLNVATRYPDKVEGLILIRNAWTDKPMPPKTVKAYHDMGEALREKNIDEFYNSEGWQIVEAEHSNYTTNAFTCTFKDESCLRYWQKYLILPPQTPIPNVEVLQKITKPVSILACRGDMCHPFEFGEYLHKLIPQSSFTEIPSKDADGAKHKKMINVTIRNFLKDCTINQF